LPEVIHQRGDKQSQNRRRQRAEGHGYAQPAEDRIDAVLDYDFVRAGVQALVADRHFHLQETLCEAIAALCLADPRVERVTVRTSKPDVYPDAAVGCEIVRGR